MDLKRVTNAEKAKMVELREEGLPYTKISEETGFCVSAIQYQLNIEEARRKGGGRVKAWREKKRAAGTLKTYDRERNQKRTDYMRDYARNKYQNNSVYREKQREISKEYQRKKREREEDE